MIEAVDILFNLPDLSEAEVAPFNLARLPPSAILENFREEWFKMEHIVQRWDQRGFPGRHVCDHCNGKLTPNPDFIPSDQQRADPCVWIWQRRYEMKPGYGPLNYDLRDKGSIDKYPTHIVESMTWGRESDPGPSMTDSRVSVLKDFEVFYQSAFYPCPYSFDWKALTSLSILAMKPPTATETIEAALIKDLSDVTKSERHAFENGTMHTVARANRSRYYEVVEIMTKYEQMFEDGELDEIKRELRTVDFGEYDWSFDFSSMVIEQPE